MRPSSLVCLMWITALGGVFATPVDASDDVVLKTRKRIKGENGQYVVEEKATRWDPKKTAIIICDMWNQHWCAGATRRVAEMAPRMNEVIAKARDQGVFIIHAPSGTLQHYAETPQRKLAQSAPRVEAKVPLQGWCSLDEKREAPLPIDDSDGGCDCVPQCRQHGPWTRQIDTLEIREGDAITDSAEAYYLLEARNIDNVIVMGVHTNMCVLGRPFSIRQLVYQDKNVVLMRDMTDTMYNSRRSPWVSHFRGTDLVVEHIEKYWCPTITSADILGGEPFTFRDNRRPRVVFLIGEDEYDTRTTVPAFVEGELAPRGIRPAVIHVSPEDPNDFPGLDRALPEADVLFLSVRRRTPGRPQLDAVRRHIEAGKPVIGIRTASHAFDRDAPDADHARWATFDRDVLGAHYQGHFAHNEATLASTVAGSAGHPVLKGVEMHDLPFTTSLYRSRDLAPTTQVLVTGRIKGNPEPEPIAWVNLRGDQRVFYTSLGGVEDFRTPAFRRLLLNAVLWASGLEVPIEPLRHRGRGEEPNR